ncbi:hypothetical protein BSLG_001158 [Batrachochytrium salamandrivorans]|nr:hypothetical protein BSLG_001158 [Batrachochytrium salamandrivorans]
MKLSHRSGRSTTTDAVVIDAWAITIVPGFIKFPVRIISMVEFNEHDRICSHEDVWSARDMLATLPAGLGWVYDAVRTLNGALSSVWIEAVVGLGKSFRSIPKGVGPFQTQDTQEVDPSYAAMSAEVDADGDVTAIAVPIDAHMNQALHASSSKTSGSPPRSVALHSPAPSDIDSVSSSASHRLPTTTPTSSSSSPLRHSSPATSLSRLLGLILVPLSMAVLRLSMRLRQCWNFMHLGERYCTRDPRGATRNTGDSKLKDGADRELLTNLVVSLRSRPIRWISGFIDHGGFAVLLDNLNELEMAKIHNEFEELYIKCLKSLMNNKIGLSAVLDTDEALNVIALSLRSPSPRTRALVLEIFGAVCLIPGGHSLCSACHGRT